MERTDMVLADLFSKVRWQLDPEDHPTSTCAIARDIDFPLEEVVSFCHELAGEGFIKISVLNSPPLVYITHTGLVRAKRLEAEATRYKRA